MRGGGNRGDLKLEATGKVVNKRVHKSKKGVEKGYCLTVFTLQI